MRASICLLVLCVSVATPALADDKAKAKALYEQGLKHYNVAEWQDAIKAWKEAYLLSRRPLLLFNIGQAYRLSGDCTQAGVFYDSYVREEPSPKNQDELDQAIALCKDARPAADRQKLDDRPATVGPTQPVVEPAPAPPPAAPPVAIAPPASELPRDAPAPSSARLRHVGIGVGAAGIVFTGLAVVFALDASGIASDLSKHTGEWSADEIDREARGKRSALLGKVTAGVGVAALVTGGVLFVMGKPRPAESGVSIAPTRGGAEVGWTMRF